MKKLKMFAESLLGSSELMLTKDSFVHYLTTDESIFEKIHFEFLTEEEFTKSVFSNERYSYKHKLNEAVEILNNMGIEEHLVNKGKLYIRGFSEDNKIIMIRYGIYSKC